MNAVHTPGPWRASVGAGYVAVMVGRAIDSTLAITTTCTPEGVANARLMAAAPEMLEALEVLVAAGADLQAGKRDGATMGRVSLATDAARALLARIRGAETQPRPDPLDVLREILDWYAHSTDADGDMPPELHARLIRAVGGEVVTDGEVSP